MLVRDMRLRQLPAAPMRGRRSAVQACKSGIAWVAEWIESCAHHYAAALLYERLSRLSDAELAARGLDRATLAHDLIRQQEGASRPAAKREGRP